ncbi:fibronectin type III domain-containing protein [Paenibacillus humicola]|uniref:RCC1 domain-containing protein n=1 Tax=Paenibacillus humicola TaxID=3110540 RepID=UPI00237C08A5|nr:fibronectin type III domain-containing protein [Paenibacillus humicola]
MKRQLMLFIFGMLLLTLLLPFQAFAAVSSSTVVAESSKSGVTMIDAGGPPQALTTDGSVWQWSPRFQTPAKLQGLGSVVAISVGIQNNLVLQSDGTVWAWGDNYERQLGLCDPTDGSDRTTPVQVCNLSSMVAIASGDIHNLALKSDGTVWTWGDNRWGQLGDGRYSSSDGWEPSDIAGPVQVQDLRSVVAIAAGEDHSLALKSDGTVWAWGSNAYGQLGIGSRATYTSNIPVQVQGLSSVVAIAANGYHNLAVKSDGTVWQWGFTTGGEMYRFTPEEVQGLHSVSAVAAGYDHNLALKTDGTVWAWGDNSSGQLGDGTTTRHYYPAQVKGLGSVEAIAAGIEDSLALTSDGTVWNWGWIGINATTPVQVQGIGGSTPETPQWPKDDVLTVTDATYNSVQLNWQPAMDDTGVDKYLVYRDNTLLATLNGDVNSYEVKGLSPKTYYLFTVVAVDADSNQSLNQGVIVTTAAVPTSGSFQLSDSKTYSDDQHTYRVSLYYGYLSSPNQVLSGSWTFPKGEHGKVNVSMISPEGKNYDLRMETAGDGHQIPITAKELPDGTEYSAAEIPEGYTASWSVKGHTAQDYSPNKKVFVYVSIQSDNH